ncbi:MAG: ThuA domain-containing protein [Phycisphaerae bacterium]|nr:ThuA domain-containing protein [Phycisphaerae bacterium]
MRKIHWLLTVGAVLCVGGCTQIGQRQVAQKPETHAGEAKPTAPAKKILFYSQSFGFRHSVVNRPLTGEMAHAEKVFKEIATKAGYDVFFSQDHNDLTGDQYKQYDAIVFYTSGNPLISREPLMKWIRDGGAFIGIHSATDSFRGEDKGIPGWPEYVKMIGAAFETHHAQRVATLKIDVTDHPATKMLEQGWKLQDEYYLFGDSFSTESSRLLVSVDTQKTSEDDLKAMGMKPGSVVPIAWTRTEGKGKVFYTSLGHREDVWTNPAYQKHLLGGIAWALGLEK